MSERERPALRRREGTPACPYCREPLHEAGRACSDCGVALHTACRAELGRCPTAGCAGSARRDAVPERGGPRRHEAWRPEGSEEATGRGLRWLDLVQAAVGGLVMALPTYFVVAVLVRHVLPSSATDPNPLRGPAGVAAVLVGALVFRRLLREARGEPNAGNADG